jgi:hypothetical protein
MSGLFFRLNKAFLLTIILLISELSYADGLGGLSAMTALALMYAAVFALIPLVLFIIAFNLRKKKYFTNPVMLLLIIPIVLFGGYYSMAIFIPPYEIYTSLIGVIGLLFIFSVYWLFKNRLR